MCFGAIWICKLRAYGQSRWYDSETTRLLKGELFEIVQFKFIWIMFGNKSQYYCTSSQNKEVGFMPMNIRLHSNVK